MDAVTRLLDFLDAIFNSKDEDPHVIPYASSWDIDVYDKSPLGNGYTMWETGKRLLADAKAELNS